jgi:putative ABC transport system permease protein
VKLSSNGSRMQRIRRAGLAQYIPDLRMGMQNLLLNKVRSLLTMLGIIFGVAAVIAMMSIGAGARQQVMAFIEQLGVRNLIVEAKEANAWDEWRNTRRTSPGLTLRDYRTIQASTPGLVETTPRKRFTPGKMIPKPERDTPVLYGVNPNYQQIAGLHVVAGRFYDAADDADAAAVVVLGQGAKSNLFGANEAIGEYVKVNDQWLQVIGVVGPQVSSPGTLEGLPAQDLNNLMYVPLSTALLRMEDSRSPMRDEIDGIYVQVRSAAQTVPSAAVVRGILDSSHRGANDFSVIIPAELLAEQQRTQRIFDLVMVAIASISLLVGGIGIMNIMLASILERTREIGVRRAVGARQHDVVRQFLMEAVLISLVGGLIGIAFGFGMSRVIAWLAGWSTIMTLSSILLSFFFSVTIGLVFGIFPAMKAARLDPVEAIRHE